MGCVKEVIVMQCGVHVGGGVCVRARVCECVCVCEGV